MVCSSLLSAGSLLCRIRERDRQESVDEQEEDVREYFEEMVGNSAALRRVQRLIEVVAPTDATVLILGETAATMNRQIDKIPSETMSARRTLGLNGGKRAP